MKPHRLLFAIVILAIGLACAPCFAQTAKPWEKPSTKVGEEITGPDAGKMVWVPAGEFMMGSPPDEGDGDEHPAHRVRLTKGFWLGKCEITNAQYRAFCAATGRAFPALSSNGPLHPVVGVSWKDAKAYCDHYGLALPTEAQWEYAARGPRSLRYPWGDKWDAAKCCNADNMGPGDIGTMAVGSLAAGNSWCGASDMAGNVWEWCADRYDTNYYAHSPVDDPTGPTKGTDRLVLGGSWSGDVGNCRSAVRDWSDQDSRYVSVGFRCALTP